MTANTNAANTTYSTIQLSVPFSFDSGYSFAIWSITICLLTKRSHTKKTQSMFREYDDCDSALKNRFDVILTWIQIQRTKISNLQSFFIASIIKYHTLLHIVVHCYTLIHNKYMDSNENTTLAPISPDPSISRHTIPLLKKMQSSNIDILVRMMSRICL